MATNNMKVNAGGGFDEPPRTPEVMARFPSLIFLQAGLNDEFVGRSVVEV